jgi:hypothetical protein
MCGIDWIDLDQDRDEWRSLANAAMSPLVPQTVGKFLRMGGTCGFPGRALAQSERTELQ